MSKSLSPAALGKAITEELEMYSQDVTEKINAAGAEAGKKLVKLTKQRAPKDTGDFKKSIALKEVNLGAGQKKFIWYVKAPLHRITHLLVHGHAKQNGGRVPGDPFLENSLNEVLPEYEKNVEEAIKNG